MQLSELDWLKFLKKRVPKKKNVLVGIGDDCALVHDGRQNLLLKSDLFVENVHFPAIKRRGLALPASGRRGGKLKTTSFKTIGMRAVARVLSDFAACSGMPKFIGISLGLPSYIKDQQLKEILNGVLAMGKKYDFSLIGGDTGYAPVLFLDVWGVGVCKKFVSRSGAKIGDYIFLTGKLGERKFNKEFIPRLKEAAYLTNNFKINSMIDISDGFLLDLSRMLTASKKGALLIRENIPVSSGESDLYRGEDYELIFTISAKEKSIERLKKKFHFVGRIKPASFGYRMQSDTKMEAVKVKGYMHF